MSRDRLATLPTSTVATAAVLASSPAVGLPGDDRHHPAPDRAVTIGGVRFRLHLRDVFGGAVLPVTAVARPAGGRAGGSGVQAGTALPVTFGGRASVSVSAGIEALSDPLNLSVPSGADLAVTLYLATGQASSNITSYPGSRTTSYLVRGNHLTDTTMIQGAM
jgi:hypothetical protein